MKHVIKRIFDFTFSFVMLIILAPLMTLIIILVKINLGSPVFFVQQRPGKDGKIFKMYKFRTMTDDCGKDGNILSDEKRLTGFGKLLRRSSLDELPELYNILIGDMSFVGPRPLLVRYLDRYTKEQARRHAVKPGLTGWAQVNGRNAISWEDKFKLDLWYVDNRTLWLDFKIMCMTVVKVLCRENINSENQATMEEFYGTDKK